MGLGFKPLHLLRLHLLAQKQLVIVISLSLSLLHTSKEQAQQCRQQSWDPICTVEKWP